MSSPIPERSSNSSLRTVLGTERNVVAWTLMLAGCLCLAAFHFTPINADMHGWHLWLRLADYIQHGQIVADHDAMLGFSAFLGLTFVTISNPFMINWLTRSRTLKWTLVVFSAMAAGIMWFFFLTEGPQLALFLLALTPTLTLTGLLFVKSHSPTLPPSAPDPSPSAPE